MTLGGVAIVGAGQIGTMLGIALRASGAAAGVVLHDLDASTAEASRARGAGDAVVTLAEALARETVVLALPVPQIVDLLAREGAQVRPGTFVIDTGSAKAVVADTMRRTLADGVHAIGGHPIAGGERPGPAGADVERLRGATFALTPVRDDATALERAKELVAACGARPLVIDATLHDRVLARTSHLPHVLAYALALTADAAGETSLVRALSAGGFRDATRLAASDARMVAGFLAANAEEVRVAARELTDGVAAIVDALDDAGALAEVLAAAGTVRERLA